MGSLGGTEGEGLKEDHKEGLRGTDMRLPERQLWGGNGGYKGFDQGLGVKLVL